jgi:hypothetical protein
MAKKKKKSRIKKFLKGAALAGAAALGAKALMGNKGTGLTTGKFMFSPAAGGARYNNPRAKALKAMTSNAAYSDQSMPGNLSANMGMNRKEFMPGIQDYYKKGGRVGCGVAKKGFGRAMKKGGKK